MLQDLEAFCRQRRSLFYPKTDLPYVSNVEADRRPPPLVVAELCGRLLAAQAVTITPLEAGTFHWLYRARFSDDRAVIVRINALGERQRDFPLYLDSWAMKVLQARSLPALAVLQVDLSRQSYPWDYEILEEARGVPLRTFDQDEGRIQPLLSKLGSVVARVHEIATEDFGLLDLRSIVAAGATAKARGLLAAWREYIWLNLEKHVGLCRDIGAVSSTEAGKIRAVFASLAPLLDAVKPVLSHGDLGNHNVFTDGQEITALIDWEDSLSGDPVYEIAFWATFHPERRHRAFLDGYRSRARLPSDFELRFWLYFLRVALAKTVLRHRFQLADPPGRPPAARRIQMALERVAA
jgi:hypothetical protein